ncbi:MAG: transporter small permease [Citricoccus sp.]|nr:transporter small permease [Citricoccus sp. WCRC_4]
MNTTQTAGRSAALRRAARSIAVPLGALASLSTLAIMVAIVIDVVVRNAGGRSVPGLLEMSETALVATVFLGLAYAGVTNSHVAVDLFTEALRPRVARVLIALAWLVGVLITAWLVLATFERAVESTEAGELRQGLMDWPLWPARWLVVIGLVAFLLVALVNIVLLVRGEPLLGEDEPDPDLAAAHEARLEERLEHHHAIGPEAQAHTDDAAPARTADSTHRPEEGRS